MNGRRVLIAHVGSMALAAAVAEVLAQTEEDVEFELVEPEIRAFEMLPSELPPSIKTRDLYARSDKRSVPKPKDLYRQRKSGKRP